MSSVYIPPIIVLASDINGVQISPDQTLIIDIQGLNGSGSTLPPVGPNVMSGSTPVTIAYDQVLTVSGITVTSPSGSSTSALQITGNTILSNISTQLPSSLGPNISHNSLPVTLAYDQVLTISGVTITPPSGSSTSANQIIEINNLELITGFTSNIPVKGGNTIINSMPVNIAYDQVLTVSGVSVTFPSGSSTSALQITGNTLLNEIVTNTTGLATSANQSTIQTTLNTISSNVSTAANQVTGNGFLNTIVTNTNNIPVKGGNVTSGSTPVNIASDQVVPVSIGSLPLPTGAATSALQISSNSILTTITGQLPASLGAKTTTASMAVNIASDQTIPVSGNLNISASTLPLGIGAATSSLQLSGNSSLNSIITNTTGIATSALQTSGNNILNLILTGATPSGTNTIGNINVYSLVGISASTLPIPTGAATSALQTTISGQLPTTLGTKTIVNSLAVNIASDQVVPVSGNFNVYNTVGVSASTLPLPIGAATATNQSSEINLLNIISTAATPTGSNIIGKIGIDQTTPGTTNKVSIGTDGTVGITGSLPAGTNTIGSANVYNTVTISASTLPIPTGAATSSNQSIEINNLELITGFTSNIPVKGGNTIVNSMPVNIASDQVLTVSGVTISFPSGSSTSNLQITGNTLLTNISNQLPTTLGTKTTSNSLAVNIASDQVVPVSGNFNIYNTVGISASTLPLPTLAATSTNQATEISSLASIVTNTTGIATAVNQVTGNNILNIIATAATPSGINIIGKMGIDQTTPGTTNKVSIGTDGTVGISGSLPLPTGAATSVNQVNEINNLSLITGFTSNIPSKGGNTTVNSIPVNIAYDQVLTVSGVTVSFPSGSSTSALQISGNTLLANIVTNTTGIATSANQNINNNTLNIIATAATPSGTNTIGNVNVFSPVGMSATTLPLPTGASTAALQTTISGQLPTSLGGKIISNSLAVNIASDQVVPVSIGSLPLPTGASTSALQTTGNSSLASIVTNTTGLATSTLQSTGNNTLNIIATAATPSGTNTIGKVGIDQTTPGTTNKVSIGTDGTIGINTALPSGTNTIGNTNVYNIVGISASTLPLPTGAATSANQSTEISSLGSIVTNTTGIATSANQTIMISSLSNIDNNTINIPPLGGAPVSGSTPVGLSTRQYINGISGVTSGNNIVSPDGSTVTDCLSWNSGIIKITTTAGISGGVISFKCNTSLIGFFQPLQVVEANLSNQNPITSLTLTPSSTRYFAFPIYGRYITAQITTPVSGGTVSGELILSQLPFASTIYTIQQATAANLNATVTTTQLPTTLGTKTIANSTAVSIASDQTVPISVSSLPLPTGGATSALQTTGNASLASIDAGIPNLGAAVTSASMPVNIASDQVVNVLQATITKGTQGTEGVTTQDLKDAGRAQVMLSWEEMTGTAAAESSLTNFTLGSRNISALTQTTSYTVSAGKTLRIQNVSFYVKTTSTVNNLAKFRIRAAASSIANTSPVIFDQVLALPVNGTYLAGELVSNDIVIPDGLEVTGTNKITFTWNTAAITCTVGMTIIGYEY